MQLKGKPKASVSNNGNLLKTSFVLVFNISYTSILGMPLINLITPYTVTYNSIYFKDNKVKLSFFFEKPRTRYLNIVKAHFMYNNEINALIKGKETDLFDLKQNVHF